MVGSIMDRVIFLAVRRRLVHGLRGRKEQKELDVGDPDSRMSPPIRIMLEPDVVSPSEEEIPFLSLSSCR